MYLFDSFHSVIMNRNVSVTHETRHGFKRNGVFNACAKIRLLTTSSPDGHSRLAEVEAWTGPSTVPRYNFIPMNSLKLDSRRVAGV